MRNYVVAMAEPRIRLVVLFGGQSAEHDVSRVTAAHVLRAADPSRYDVRPIAITRDGHWVFAEGAARALAAGADTLPAALDAMGPSIDPSLALSERDETAGLVVFPLLHGPLGEDGTIQGMLELLDVAYVGTGVLGSAIGMDKAAAKEILSYRGVPVAPWVTVRAHEHDPATATALAYQLGLPVFVKPANMGSSIGVSRASDTDELDAALRLAFSYDEVVVVEQAIAGREIEVAVLGDLDPRASVPGEIVPSHTFYDYADKYLDDGAKLLVPAPLDEHQSSAVRQLALDVFGALRGSGMARVDFFYEEDGRGFLCNEINTIPGFTPISMYPKLWEASGVGYSDLIDELVRLAQARHARRRRRTDR